MDNNPNFNPNEDFMPILLGMLGYSPKEISDVQQRKCDIDNFSFPNIRIVSEHPKQGNAASAFTGNRENQKPANNDIGDIAMNVYRDENHTTIKMELAGFDKKNICVDLVDNKLLVTAERQFGASIIHRELPLKKQRYVPVPSGMSVSDFTVSYANGILTIVYANTKTPNIGKIQIL